MKKYKPVMSFDEDVANVYDDLAERGGEQIRRDHRWMPSWENLIAPQLSSAMRVLDVGCGNGQFLLEISESFHTGLGIDNDPAHIQMAEGAKREQGN